MRSGRRKTIPLAPDTGSGGTSLLVLGPPGRDARERKKPISGYLLLDKDSKTVVSASETTSEFIYLVARRTVLPLSREVGFLLFSLPTHWHLSLTTTFFLFSAGTGLQSSEAP